MFRLVEDRKTMTSYHAIQNTAMDQIGGCMPQDVLGVI